MRRTLIFGLAGAMAFTACSSSKQAGTSTGPTSAPNPTAVVTSAPATAATTPVTAAETSTTTARPAPQADPALQSAVQQAVEGAPPGCDPTDTRHCYLPYPSDRLTTADLESPTKRRVVFPPGQISNADGVAIDMAEWNRNDGFSPNSTLLTFVPGLDPAASKLPPWSDLGASLEDASTVVLIDRDSATRVALWAEPDAKATEPGDRMLVIHPAVSLPEGHTYVAALRGMVGSDGKPVAPNPVFEAYRDGLLTGDAGVEAYRPEMERDFAALAAAGVPRHDLYLAWHFTVASTDGLAARMLHIRDDALTRVGETAPAFTVDKVTPNVKDGVALQVEGTYTVPNYLTADGSPGNAFHYDVDPADNPDALPSVNPGFPTLQAPYVCDIGTATMAGTAPAHIVQYGHGLLGSNHEIEAGNVRAFANESNIVFCATKWAGMSEDDISNAVHTLQDFSSFATMADRLQQGVLDQIFLSRLMLRPDGLASANEFRRPDGSALLDSSELSYDGNSQGGIMGAMFAAVSPDIHRAVLGVPGMNYSLLLPRSVDFDTYEAVMKPAYPSELDRMLIIAVTQMLWDRGEGAGYVQHLTAEPYPNTPAKTVLLDVAYGDHQVSELAAMVEARTIGATIHRPVTTPDRAAGAEQGWGLEATSYPSSGSAVIVWDSGMAPMPVDGLPPATGDDSHEDPRADPDVRRQKAAFLFEHTLVDVCGGEACTADHVS